MRVGLIIGQLTVGGAEGQLAELVRGLDKSFTPFVYSLASTDEPLARRLEDAGATVRQIGGRGLPRVRRLTEALRSDAIELVHSWLFIANAYAAATKLFGCRAPLITSARNCKVQSRANQLANALAFRASRAIIVNSTDVDAFIVRNYRAPHKRIRVIYNGVDAQRFHPAGEPPREPLVITVGRLVRQKNHELFLQAAARLARDIPDVRFAIVGNGPNREELEKLAGELGLRERVRFAGERHDVADLLRQASLFWLTSRWEGMPNVVLEAMASGLPIIATDVGGVRELVRPGEDGFIVPDQRAEGFVAPSRRLLREVEHWSEFSRSARARAEEFSTPKMVAALARVYEETIGSVS